MVQTSAAKRQSDVERLNNAAKLLTTDLSSPHAGDVAEVLSSRRPRLDELNSSWNHLKRSVKDKQIKLEDAIREVGNAGVIIYAFSDIL